VASLLRLKASSRTQAQRGRKQRGCALMSQAVQAGPGRPPSDLSYYDRKQGAGLGWPGLDGRNQERISPVQPPGYTGQSSWCRRRDSFSAGRKPSGPAVLDRFYTGSDAPRPQSKITSLLSGTDFNFRHKQAQTQVGEATGSVCFWPRRGAQPLRVCNPLPGINRIRAVGTIFFSFLFWDKPTDFAADLIRCRDAKTYARCRRHPRYGT
jgi:hypothetical protein